MKTCKKEVAILKIREAIDHAVANNLPDARAATLATATADGSPSARTVYIEFCDSPGPIFFANSRSGKGRQLIDNPNASLCFFWPSLQLQVLVDGPVTILPQDSSEEYWNKRSRESQLAAWASEQSAPMKSPGNLKKNIGELKAQFSFEQIPMASNWLAFQLEPIRVEIWNTGWGRLRARTKYFEESPGHWRMEAENP